MSKVIVHDHKNKKSSIEIENQLLIDNIIEMQKVGMDVNCHDIDTQHPQTLPGYTITNNAYLELIDKYESITCKQMKKW